MRILLALLVLVWLGPLACAAEPKALWPSSTAGRWENGPGGDENFFPIAVWLQSPRNAAKYKAIGINLYVGLWQGPTEAQLEELERHRMPVICSLNEYARTQLARKIIVGWMHGDEPDNAQSLGSGKGYGPPIPPEKIVADYHRLRAVDSTRPILLNLGQGVAWDGWHGRGVRSNHPEDYPHYARGGDIVSFDIYPVVHDKPAVAGKLWYVPRGVTRLRQWAGPDKPTWTCIETTRISNPRVKPTAEQVKAEVWMALIHGSQGLIYFSHQFKPQFVEAGLLADPEMATAVGAINREIQGLAAVLQSATLHDALTVTTEPPKVSAELASVLPQAQPVAVLVKRHSSGTYLFAVGMENSRAKATFVMPELSPGSVVEVMGEDRTIPVQKGRFQDMFNGHAVHLYRVVNPRKQPREGR